MANQQINQYTLERQSLGDDDFFDIDYWNGSAFQTAKIKGSIIKSSTSPGIWSQTADGPLLANTTTETTIIGSGVGSLTIPADTWIKGQSYELRMWGEISAIVNDGMNFSINNGPTKIVDTGGVTFFDIGVGGAMIPFEIIMSLTCREVGPPTTGKLQYSGQVNTRANSGGQFRSYGFNILNTANFDTTIDNVWNITGKWDNADPGNQVRILNANLKRTF